MGAVIELIDPNSCIVNFAVVAVLFLSLFFCFFVLFCFCFLFLFFYCLVACLYFSYIYFLRGREKGFI